MKGSVVFALLFALGFPTFGYAAAPDPPTTLTIGQVQLSWGPTLEQNRAKMVQFVGQAKHQGCRVVVFPEGALGPLTTVPEMDAALQTLIDAATSWSIYVLLNHVYAAEGFWGGFNRLLVVNPNGQVIQEYRKIDDTRSDLPGVFYIDGIPCNASICSDRWIRGTVDLPVFDGSKIIFECSHNFADEWKPELQWYWYVPMALRNGAYVATTNIASNPAYPPDYPDQSDPDWLLMGNKHGHCALVAPDGTLLDTAGTEADRLLVNTIDLTKATRAEAIQRRNHSVFQPFWDTGVMMMDGGTYTNPGFTGYRFSPAPIVKMAAAQMACSRNIADNVSKMKTMIQAAATSGANVVVFPELCVTGALAADILAASPTALDAALQEIKTQAAASQIHVIFGMPYVKGVRRYDAVFVVGPQGTLLTRHAALATDHPEMFDPGLYTKDMWFPLRVGSMDVWSLVSVGRKELLWNEIAELAACRGAQTVFHIGYDTDTTTQGALLQRQLQVNFASFRTYTATVNAASPTSLTQPSAPASGRSIIWEEFFRDRLGTPHGYGYYSAQVMAEAGTGEQIIYASTQTLTSNPYFGGRPSTKPAKMKDWFELGVQRMELAEPPPSLSASPVWMDRKANW